MTGKWHGGKGSNYRPVDNKKYSDNWDKIFGSKKKETDEKDLKFTTAEDYMNDNPYSMPISDKPENESQDSITISAVDVPSHE